MGNILNRLKNGEVLVADGAMGTMLIQRGLKGSEIPEEYNLSHPEILTEIADAYLQAGAEIIETNTFGASPLKLSGSKLDQKVIRINKEAVRAVRNAVGHKAYISGSCGPTGKLVKPYGDTDPKEMYESFKIQIEALIEAGIDILCIETMTDTNEAVEAIKAARELSQNLPIIATMTYEKIPKGFYTIMGVSIEEGSKALKNAGADILGSNCGNGIDKMILIAEELKKHTDLPIIIQANAGIPEMIDNEPHYPETPQYMAGKVKDLISAGASIIGGCCGTTPEHIKAIKKVVDTLRPTV